MSSTWDVSGTLPFFNQYFVVIFGGDGAGLLLFKKLPGSDSI